MESGKISKDLAAQIMNITELEELISQIAVNVPLTYQNKQKILEAVSLENQYEVLAAILNNEIEVLQIGHDLQRKLKARVDKNQRDYILREQLKLIREGLNVAEGTPIVPYSAVTKQGRDEIWELIETYAMAPEEELSEEH